MGLDAVDTAKSTFGSLNTETGLKVVSLLFVVQLVNMLGTMMYSSGASMAMIGGLLTFIAAAASVVATIGGLRSLDTDSFETEQYTKNLFWPFVRLAGANITSTIFAYGLGFLAFLPALLAAALTGSGVSAPATLASGSPIAIAIAAITILGLLAGIAAFSYVFLTLVVSLPMVTAGDSRLFEALDQSVQRTRGNLKAMFVAALPVFALYIVATAAMLALAPSQGTMNIAFGAVSALISAVVGTAFFSLLTEYNHRLPEA